MTHKLIAKITFGFLMVFSSMSMSNIATAQTPNCDALSQKQQELKREIFASFHPYAACDDTFERCLAKKPLQPVVVRLANDLCRQIKEGKSRQDMQHALAKRAQSMLPTTKPATIIIDENTRAGDPRSPVKAVVYACARCPYCKVLVTALYQEVTKGSLKGKVKIYFRPFPIKSHPGSVEGGLAMISAARLGGFWPLVNKMYERYERFCPKLLPDWAAETGMLKEMFAKEMAEPKTREALVITKQEGLKNKVEATPTLFIDDRKYVYEMKLEPVLDVLNEAYETASASGKK